MVDIESFGAESGSVVVSIGACVFDPDKIGEHFYRALDVTDSLLYGLTIDVDTMTWWRGQHPDAKGALRPQVRLMDGLADFARFVGEADEVWAKGPDFDLVLLDAVYRATGQRIPWKYRNARDVRTMLSLVPPPPDPDPGTKHHALHDAIRQARQVQFALANLKPGQSTHNPSPERG